MSEGLANTSTQRLTDVQSAAANGGYYHLRHRQQVTLRKFLEVLAVNLRQPATDGTWETASAGMVQLLAAWRDAVSMRFALHEEPGDTSEAQTTYRTLVWEKGR
jgi:hypothetical protein